MTQFRFLRDLAVQIRGVTYAKEEASSVPVPGSVPILRAGNIQDSRITFDDLVYVPRTLVGDQQLIRRHDVLVATSSGSLDVVGKAAQATTDVEMAFGAFCKVLRPRPNVDPRYLGHFFRTAGYRRSVTQLAAGVSINNLRNEHLDELLVPVPSMEDQRRLADILDKADAVRRARREAMALTEDLLTSTFLHIVGPAAEGSLDWPLATVESLAALAPNSMRTGPFGSDLLHSEFVNEGIAVLGIDNAVRNRFAWAQRRFITPEKYERLRRYTVRPGDVIVTIMGTTGRSAVVPSVIPTAITTKHLATITVDRERAEPEFVSQSLVRHPDVLRQINAANRGAIMSGLNLGLIKALQVRVPPLDRQRLFSRVTERIRSLASRMENERLDEDLFNSLVAKAFSGQLSRPNAEC